MNEHLRARVAEAVKKVKQNRTASPGKWTERDTERRAIEPILEALGYPEIDYTKGQKGKAGDFPDYKMLHETDSPWYLEAKAWDERIELKAKQAVNYANNEGNKWAVITNGQRWIIYEANRQAEVSGKVVEDIDALNDPDAPSKLAELLSKEAMEDDRLQRVVDLNRLRQELEAELGNPESRLLAKVRRWVKDNLRIDVSPADLAQTLCVKQLGTSPPAAMPAQPVRPARGGSREMSLQAAMEQDLPDSKPCGVLVPGDGFFACKAWSDVLLRVVECAWRVRQFSVPLSRPGQRSRCIVNWEPKHPAGKRMFGKGEVRLGGRIAYVEINNNAPVTVRHAVHVSKVAGLEPSEIILRFPT